MLYLSKLYIFPHVMHVSHKITIEERTYNFKTNLFLEIKVSPKDYEIYKCFIFLLKVEIF